MLTYIFIRDYIFVHSLKSYCIINAVFFILEICDLTIIP